MRQIPISLILVGLLFTLLNVQVVGQDIFIDAVGYLVAWNGLRVLDKTNKKIFLFASPFCLALVVICAIQLFIKNGSLLTGINVIRIIFEILFYIQLYYGFLKMGEQDRIKHIKLGVVLSIVLCVISFVVKLVFSLSKSSFNILYIANEISYYVLIIMVSVSFLWFRYIFKDKVNTTKK